MLKVVQMQVYPWYNSDYGYGDDGPGISFASRYLDFRARNPSLPLLHITMAGESCSQWTDYVTWKDYNGLTVGGTNENGDWDRSNDTIWARSSWKNPDSPHGDREKPELCAPAYNLNLADYNGTSTRYAASMVAGAAAAVCHSNTNMFFWPVAVRAILMTTADQNVDGPVLNLNDSIDDKDGAGEVNELMASYLAYDYHNLPTGNTESTAVSFGYHHNYITPNDFNNNYPSDYKYGFYVKSPDNRNATVRITLAWDATATCENGDYHTTCSDDHIDCDLDLHVYEVVNGSHVAYMGGSYSYDNNFEFLQFEAQGNHTYWIEINDWTWNENATYMALAFEALAHN